MNKEQVRAARAWLNLTQQDLATDTMIDKRTIARFELGVGVPHDRTLRDMRRALEARGVEFLFEGATGVGIRVHPKRD